MFPPIRRLVLPPRRSSVERRRQGRSLSGVRGGHGRPEEKERAGFNVTQYAFIWVEPRPTTRQPCPTTSISRVWLCSTTTQPRPTTKQPRCTYSHVKLIHTQYVFTRLLLQLANKFHC